MDLSRGHFYKTIEEAETAIKQYSKEHYFIRRWESPPTNNKNMFVRNRPRWIKKIIRPQSSLTNKNFFYSSGFPTNNDDLLLIFHYNLCLQNHLSF